MEEAIKTALKKAPSTHFDEMGQRIGGKLHWLHVTCTSRLSYYKSHPQRGKAALETIGILPVYGVREADGLHFSLEG